MKPVIKLYGLLAIVGGIAFGLSLFVGVSPCAFYHIVGLPCPACGLTRSYLSLLALDIRQAFVYHPLFILVPLIPWAAHEKILPRRQNLIWLGLLGLFAGVWVVRMAVLFPGTAPMTWNEGALLARAIGWIRGG